MTYQEQYTSFLSTLHQDTRPWIVDRDIPKDGVFVNTSSHRFILSVGVAARVSNIGKGMCNMM